MASAPGARSGAVVSFVIVAAIFFASIVRAQVTLPDAKQQPAVSKLGVSPKNRTFDKINLARKTLTETRSFTIKNFGSLALSVTVAPPVGSQFFTIKAGQGTVVMQPKGTATVTVEFAPTTSGSFSATIAITSDATSGKSLADCKSDRLGKELVVDRHGNSDGHCDFKSYTDGHCNLEKIKKACNSTNKATPTATATSSPTGSTDVLTYHNDNARTGQNLTEQILTPSNVKSSFGQLFQDSVDGLVDAQPLIKTQVTIPGMGTHNVLYVVTENDTVYAFDADSAGAPLWKVSVLGAR